MLNKFTYILNSYLTKALNGYKSVKNNSILSSSYSILLSVYFLSNDMMFIRCMYESGIYLVGNFFNNSATFSSDTKFYLGTYIPYYPITSSKL